MFFFTCVFGFLGRAALQKRIMALLRKIEHCTAGCLQVRVKTDQKFKRIHAGFVNVAYLPAI